jgi:hypothetical protein
VQPFHKFGKRVLFDSATSKNQTSIQNLLDDVFDQKFKQLYITIPERQQFSGSTLTTKKFAEDEIPSTLLIQTPKNTYIELIIPPNMCSQWYHIHCLSVFLMSVFLMLPLK